MGPNVNSDAPEFSIRESSLGNMAFVARAGRLIEFDISRKTEYEIRKQLVARYPDATMSDKNFRMIYLLLDRYLRGQKVEFHIDVDLSGQREFTRNILTELRKVPYGQVISYGGLARNAGYRNSARAAGQACGKNPIPIIIPCHRVINKDGSIGGFGMGSNFKKRLLAIEGIVFNKAAVRSFTGSR
ncbi:MAG: methylated-DNA--[protein]-cysteine S-methyltransferase [Syntrophobacterales bacterium]|jgi:methylated-DNA-[protein]-cysteine S-methyltransferase|nr:methylated-DNA--[protein]-cysteine S-methyltransferase [Syntrophobacterales bacterium]